VSRQYILRVRSLPENNFTIELGILYQPHRESFLITSLPHNNSPFRDCVIMPPTIDYSKPRIVCGDFLEGLRCACGSKIKRDERFKNTSCYKHAGHKFCDRCVTSVFDKRPKMPTTRHNGDTPLAVIEQAANVCPELLPPGHKSSTVQAEKNDFTFEPCYVCNQDTELHLDIPRVVLKTTNVGYGGNEVQPEKSGAAQMSYYANDHSRDRT
jgi:hypothetical protein